MLTVIYFYQKQLQQANKKLETIVTGIGAGLHLLDAETRVIWMNDISQKWFGPLEEIKGKTCCEIFPLKEPEKECAALFASRSGKVERTGPVAKTTTNDTIRHFQITTTPVKDGAGAIVQYVEIVQNITDRKKSEQALRQSEERYRAVVTQSGDAIFLVDIATRGIIEANQSMQHLLGYTSDEMRSLTLYDFIAHNRQDIDRKIEKIVNEGTYCIGERRYRRKDGSVVPVEVHVNLVSYGGREVMCVVTHDISERKRAEKEKELLMNELKERNIDLEGKNAEMERFTYTVSHDLKSPLITIRGFLGLLRKDKEKGDWERMEHDMERIDTAAKHMEELLSDLLELSSIGRMVNPSEEVSLGDIVSGAAKLLSGQIKERGITVEITPDLPTVFADWLRLGEVYQNFLENAVKYMGDKANPHIEMGMRREGDETVFYVRDNGMGIDPKYHEKVFGLFERLNHGDDGTGIGLAIVKRIIELHGGRIWVESEGEGKGSTFCFTLPKRGEHDE
ncbi:MAG: PAS domain S-box protein [Deltaproteobacteria bacterium]|nr:PAS domain S-box protein [Deltaproteobacteria bacterium]